jgi:AhpD family alkylhydroperoxidase
VIARGCGADEVILYRKENFVERVAAFTHGRGVDVVYDSVGADTFCGSLDCLGYSEPWSTSGSPPEPSHHFPCRDCLPAPTRSALRRRTPRSNPALLPGRSFSLSEAKPEMSATRTPIEYNDASPEVRAVYDDIMATRKTDWVNNFWKVLAHDPASLRRIWTNIKEVMGPGTIDPLVKEMLYVAVSASNGCRYCIASHSAAARSKGMTEAQYSELLAIVGLANETNRLVTALDVPVDERFL